MSGHVLEQVAIGAAPRRRRLDISGAWLLSGAMVASGALTYVFHVVAARTLGPEAYGQIAVLWGAMFLVAIVLFRPIEQTTSRAVADRLARGDEVRTVVRAALLMAAGVAIAATAAFAASWGTLTHRLFLDDQTMTIALAVGVTMYGLSYLVRGILGGTRWFAGYSLGLMADACVRLLVAAPLLVVASKLAAATAVVAAGAAGTLLPLVVGRARLRVAMRPGSGEPFRLSRAAAFAGPTALIAGADQLFVNGGPLLVIAAGGVGASRSAGVVFAATMLVRAPVYVFQGLAAALLPNLTQMHATDDSARFRRAVVNTVLFLLGCGAVIAAAMAVAGPASMRVLYGGEFHAARIDLVVLGLGTGFYLAASTVSQALLAIDQATRAAAAWTLAAVAFVGLYAVLPGGDLARVSAAFTGATVLCLVLLASLLLAQVRK